MNKIVSILLDVCLLALLVVFLVTNYIQDNNINRLDNCMHELEEVVAVEHPEYFVDEDH